MKNTHDNSTRAEMIPLIRKIEPGATAPKAPEAPAPVSATAEEVAAPTPEASPAPASPSVPESTAASTEGQS